MKFSIIIPIYNAEKTIKECIESVVNQTYLDWEIVLVDDGSTDDSGTICDEYSKRDSRIRVIHSENQGGYKARLLGNNHVSGDYVLGLDADDMYEPRLLERVNKTIIEYNPDMVVFGHSELYSNGEKKDSMFPYKGDVVYTKKEILDIAISARDHALWDKAIKYEKCITARYINAERKLVLDDDYLQVIPVVSSVESAVAIDAPLYIYRVDDESKSHDVKEDNILDADWVNCKLLEFLKKEGLCSDTLFVALMESYCKTIYPRLRLLIKKQNFFKFINSGLNRLEFMKLVNDNSARLLLRKREKIIYKYASKGHIFWGIVLSKFI